MENLHKLRKLRVLHSGFTGLESPVNPQTGMSALRRNALCWKCVSFQWRGI
jgi:hypothetical protein